MFGVCLFQLVHHVLYVVDIFALGAICIADVGVDGSDLGVKGLKVVLAFLDVSLHGSIGRLDACDLNVLVSRPNNVLLNVLVYLPDAAIDTPDLGFSISDIFVLGNVGLIEIAD